ncbi:MAG: hypothetical protein CENE_00688 [Candidatus Celerinatantimonas neptuna]|nr:MAG: hypothetical protein CENE_00688 [Candidatus Celerinatantimonas neptuna]
MVISLFQIKRWSFVRIAASAALLICLLSALWTGFKMYRASVILESWPSSTAWGLVQLQEEHRRFINTLRLYELKGNDKQQVLFRYNIFWSRFPVLLHGNEVSDLDHIPGAKALVADMFSEVQRIEPMLDSLPRTRIEVPKVLGWLESFSAPINVLVNREFHRITRYQSAVTVMFQDQQRLLLWSIVGMLIACSILFGCWWYQYRLNRWLMTHDQSTRLFSRNWLNQWLKQKLSGDEAFTVFAIELVQSQLMTADSLLAQQLLQMMVQRLNRKKSSEVYVVRIESYRLLVIYPKASHESVSQYADYLYKLMTQPYGLEHQTFYIDIKMGIVPVNYCHIEPDELLTQVNISLYQQGEPIRYFHEDVLRKIRRYYQLLEDISGALEHRQVSLLYQPVIQVNTQLPVALQIKMRWQHPQIGRIEHDELTHIAEQASFYRVLTDWLFENAFLQHKLWQQKIDSRLKLILPISLASLGTAKIALLKKHLKCSSIIPHQVMLALESSDVQRSCKLPVLLDELRKVGVTVILSEFTTSVGSWRRLIRDPSDYIKVIAPITAELTQSCYLKYLNALNQLLLMLKRQVIFEGVVAHEQLKIIQDSIPGAFVCGSIYAPFLPAADVETYLLEQLVQPA